MRKLFIAAVAAILAACQSVPAERPRAVASLQPTKGNNVTGEVRFEEVDGKVRVSVLARGLRPEREHGLHVHEAGDCSSDDGMSAKGHFNPHGKPHGAPSSSERHAGDLPALRADGTGQAQLDVTVDQLTVRPGPASVVGRGLIVHADPDDYSTQPTGNSGARLACGVIRAA